MATSGTLNGNDVDGGEGSYLTWQLASQSASANTSTINWQIGWRFSSTSCRGLRLGNGVINGKTVYNDSDSGDGVHTFSSSHNHKPRLQTASGSITIVHGSDGKKSFSASVSMTGWQGFLSKGSASWDLPSLATVPNPPTTPKISNIKTNSVDVSFSDGANGGLAIDSRQIGYGTSSSSPTTIISSNGSSTVSGLVTGTTYYFWARTHNSKGYSAWSGRASAMTLKVPDAPGTVVLANIKQASVDAKFSDNGNGGSAILERQIAYGTSSSGPTTYVTYLGAGSFQTLTGLPPGQKLYFWGRSRNEVGWGPLSAVSASSSLSAGAYVKVGNDWRRAVPWVNVGGVWKPAKAWGRVAGTWRETL